MRGFERGSLIGTNIGGIEICRLLGSGGMGDVYLARRADSDVPFALKVLRSKLRKDARMAARFRREAAALERLDHPNIVRVLEHGEIEGRWPYILMEHLVGTDLLVHVEESGPMRVGDALDVLIQVCDALEHAHTCNVVHRDLKPGNIVLVGESPNRTKVIDFGLARLLDGEGCVRVTRDGEFVGSPAFMAPEQGRGEEASPAADVYSLACTAYYLLSGAPVFVGDSHLAFAAAHWHSAPAPLSERCDDDAVPAALDRVLLSCLSKTPAERPPPAQVRVVLERLRSELGSRAGTRRIGIPPAWRSGRQLALSIWCDPGSPAHHTEHADGAVELRLQIAGCVLELARELSADTPEHRLAELADGADAARVALFRAERNAAVGESAPGPEDLNRLQRELRARLQTLFMMVREQQPKSARATSLAQKLDDLVARYSKLRSHRETVL